MDKYIKEKKTKLLKIYLIIIFISILLSVISVIITLSIGKTSAEININFMGFLAIFLLIFSIYCLVKFIKLKLNKVTYILPIWVIAEIGLAFIYAIILSIKYILAGVTPDTIELSTAINVINLIHDILQLSFTSYLIYIFYK